MYYKDDIDECKILRIPYEIKTAISIKKSLFRCDVKLPVSPQSKLSLSIQQWKLSSFIKCLIILNKGVKFM